MLRPSGSSTLNGEPGAPRAASRRPTSSSIRRLTAATAAGTWTFKRVGFWHPRITVRAPGADDDRAVFDPSWTGSGSLTVAGGPTFRWKATNFWYTRWDWQTADGAVALHFANQQGLARLEGQVGVEPAGRGLPELDLLITLGWYLIVLRANDDATVVAATT